MHGGPIFAPISDSARLLFRIELERYRTCYLFLVLQPSVSRNSPEVNIDTLCQILYQKAVYLVPERKIAAISSQFKKPGDLSEQDCP